MRKTLSVVALILCGLWGASQAKANSSICDAVPSNIVANCGFETGNFSGWTISGNTTNPGGNYYGVDAFDANSGNYGAYMSQDLIAGTAPLDLVQMLTTILGDSYQITFYVEQDTEPAAGYTHTFSATWGGTTLLSLSNPASYGAFTEYQYTETASGAETPLNFAFRNDDSYWSFDDVSVVNESLPTPEAPVSVLAGIGVLCTCLLLRRMPKRGKSALTTP